MQGRKRLRGAVSVDRRKKKEFNFIIIFTFSTSAIILLPYYPQVWGQSYQFENPNFFFYQAKIPAWLPSSPSGDAKKDKVVELLWLLTPWNSEGGLDAAAWLRRKKGQTWRWKYWCKAEDLWNASFSRAGMYLPCKVHTTFAMVWYKQLYCKRFLCTSFKTLVVAGAEGVVAPIDFD